MSSEGKHRQPKAICNMGMITMGGMNKKPKQKTGSVFCLQFFSTLFKMLWLIQFGIYTPQKYRWLYIYSILLLLVVVINIITNIITILTCDVVQQLLKYYVLLIEWDILCLLNVGCNHTKHGCESHHVGGVQETSPCLSHMQRKGLSGTGSLYIWLFKK